MISELKQPVYWMQDAYQQAATIQCDVCDTCVWHSPSIDRCMFGGPYAGYDIRQVTDLGENQPEWLRRHDGSRQ